MTASPLRVVPAGRAPCSMACPLDQNVKEYVALVAEGKFDAALDVVLRTNPLPGVLGRICSRPCERACAGSGAGEVIPIRWLKRFIADRRLEEGTGAVPRPRTPTRQESIAVVGAGPAGITAARDLASLGYAVTVLEATEQAGGLPRWAIEESRLPRRIVEADVADVFERGVELITGRRLGADFGIDDLFDHGHRAVVLAVGAWRQAGLGLEGEEGIGGVSDTIEFLVGDRVRGRDVAGSRVVVVGATREGLDAAVHAARLEASDVVVVTATSRERIAVDEGVVEDAIARGVTLQTHARPVSLRVRGGALRGLVVESVRDGRTTTIPAHVLLPAVDRFVEPDMFLGGPGLEKTAWGGIGVGPDGTSTGLPGVFAAGDAVTGPKTVVEAVASGHRAASAVHVWISGETWTASGRPAVVGRGPAAWEASGGSRPPATTGRPSGPVDALREAQRCLRCGQCLDCETCHPDCPTRVVVLPVEKDGPSLDDAIVKVHLESAPGVIGEVVALPGGRQPVAASVVPFVDETTCIGCGICTDACPYDVVRLSFGPDGAGVARIDPDACRTCGACAAACPVGAIDQPHWSTRSLLRAVERPGADVILRCHWTAGASGSDEAVVPVPCALRVDEATILHALTSGASSVTVQPCTDGACRYRSGDRHIERLGHRVSQLLATLGIDPATVTFSGAPLLSRNRSFSAGPRDVAPGATGPWSGLLLDIERILAEPERVQNRRACLPADSGLAVRGPVALYTGDLAILEPLVSDLIGVSPLATLGAALHLLNRAGVEPVILDDERPAGARLTDAGEDDAVRRLARLNCESMDRAGVRTVVTTCVGDALALGRQVRLAGRNDDIRVVPLTVFLDRGRGAGAGRTDGPGILLHEDPVWTAAHGSTRRLLDRAGWGRSGKVKVAGDRGLRVGTVGLLGAARSSGAISVACTSWASALPLLLAVRPGTWDPFGVRVAHVVDLIAGGAP